MIALTFKGGHTLSGYWEQIYHLTGHMLKDIQTDRIYRGKRSMDNTDISISTSRFPNQSHYEKRKARKEFCKRAGIEPVIGHLKSDHRMMRNYLKGTLGDAINTLMAAAAYNMRHWMNKKCLSFFCLLASDAGQTPQECDIWKKVPAGAWLSRWSRRGALAGLTTYGGEKK